MGQTEVVIGATGTKTTGFHSDKPYVVIQVRIAQGQTLRMQVGTCERDVTVPKGALLEWLAKQPASRKSMAGSSSLYAPILARPEGETGYQVRLQVPSSEPFNRDYGACFIVESFGLRSVIDAILKG